MNKNCRIIIIILFAALATRPCATAQNGSEKSGWSGFTDFCAGSSFTRGGADRRFGNTAFGGTVQAGYRWDNFQITGNIAASSNYNSSSKTGYSIKDTGNEELREDIDVAKKESVKKNVGAGLNVKWTIGKRDRITFRTGWKNSIEDFTNVNASMKLVLYPTVQYTGEDAEYDKNSFNIEGVWNHNFNDKNGKLAIQFNWDISNERRNTVWEVGNNHSGLEDPTKENAVSSAADTSRIYRISPIYFNNDKRIKASWSNEDIFGQKGLGTELSLLFRHTLNKDEHYAANYREKTWIDSTDYQISFRYNAVEIAPRARLSYSSGKWSAEAWIMPDFFYDYMKNDLETEVARVQTDPVFSVSGSWKPSDRHLVEIRAGRNIKRPDYLQMCWFRRSGALANEFQEGNRNLRSTVISDIKLSYTFTLKRFQTSFSISDRYENGTIERTFYEDTIKGINFRIFTWTNVNKTNTSSASLNVRWMDKHLKADISANFNHFIKFKDDDILNRNDDYNIRGSVSYDFDFGMNVAANARYQSKIVRTYTWTDPYIGCNLSVSQKIGKFLIYFDAKDILDHDIRVMTLSKDFTQSREEISRNNRRLLQIGVKFTI